MGDAARPPLVGEAGVANIHAMRGRYGVAYDPSTLISGFSVTRVTPFPKRWNVAPMSIVPVLRETKDGERVAETLRWGLLPNWTKDEKLATRRCAAAAACCRPPASMSGAPTPTASSWYICPRADSGEPPLFAFAGLFEAWRPAIRAKIQSDWSSRW